MVKGLEFDPGFAPHILVFQGTVEYLYMDINRFKNLSQKKVKFIQYHKKILDILYNNLGFYVGCLMWAAYLKTQDEQKILNNHCFGEKYDEKENTAEVDFMLKFLELFPRDMKYFMGENFEFDKKYEKIAELYKEFLTVNKGFVNTKTNTDLVLPNELKTDNADRFKSIIDKAIKSENLSTLIESAENILPE